MSSLKSNQIIKGSHLMVLIDVVENGISTLKPIAFSTSHTLSKQLNTTEINCKDYGDAAAIVPQNYSWTMQTDNLYSIDGYEVINTIFNNKEKVTVYFGETNYNNAGQESIVDKADSNPTEWEKEGFGEQGYAYITALDVTASAGENATFSATFTGTGTLEAIPNYPV